MERTYAAIDGGIVSNTFVGDEAFANIVRPDHEDIVEITALDPRPGVAWSIHPDGFRPPSPFPSWIWNGESWEAPDSRPDDLGSWSWDEDAVDWINLTSEPDPGTE